LLESDGVGVRSTAKGDGIVTIPSAENEAVYEACIAFQDLVSGGQVISTSAAKRDHQLVDAGP
jgi:hypothetical protein